MISYLQPLHQQKIHRKRTQASSALHHVRIIANHRASSRARSAARAAVSKTSAGPQSQAA
eukprot:4904176-Pleurochrysis_carterae.AAC.1